MTCYAWWCRGDVCEHPRVGFYVEMGLDHGIGHLVAMSSHQRLKRVSDLIILRHDDYRARD